MSETKKKKVVYYRDSDGNFIPSGSSGGDMYASKYDTDLDGIVNQADKVTNTLTIKDGSNTYTYDGSEAVEINVVGSGGSGEATSKNIFVGTQAEFDALSEDDQNAVEMFVCTDGDSEDDSYALQSEINDIKDGTIAIGNSNKLGGKSADSFYNLGIPTQSIPSGADLDNYTTEGVYRITDSSIVTNLPPTVTTASAKKVVIEYITDNRLIQTLTWLQADNPTWVRNNCGGVWQDWKRAVYTDNISNPNLLINSDFRVNQRGASSYSGACKTVDMWGKDASGTLIVNDGYITLDSTDGGYCWINQYIENIHHLLGKTVTASIRLKDGTLYQVSGTVPSEIPTTAQTKFISYILSNLGIHVYVYSSGYIRYSIATNPNLTIDIEYVKLELGNVATPLSPRPYAEELALCQRYFVNLNLDKQNFATFGRVVGVRSANNLVYIVCDLPVSLRSVNSLTLNYGGTIGLTLLNLSADIVVESLVLNVVNNRDNQIFLTATVSDTTNVQVGGSLRAYNDASAYICISAEL